MTPQGHFVALTKALKSHTHYGGSLASLQAYLRSPAFREHFAGVGPDKIESALQAIARAQAICEIGAPRPAKPKSFFAKRSEKTNWADTALRAKLANAYAKHGPTAYKAVAAEMRMTAGQVRIAKRRYLDAAATPPVSRAA